MEHFKKLNFTKEHLVLGLSILLLPLLPAFYNTYRKLTHNSSNKSSKLDKLIDIFDESSCVNSKKFRKWNTAFFFPCHSLDEKGSSVSKLLFYLSEGEKSIKLCVMTLSYRPVIELLIKKHNEGVRIQLYTSFHCAKKSYRLRNEGIQIKSGSEKYSTEMHHKYVIIDDDGILSGSLNWTIQSITQQRENIVVTTDPRIVKKFIDHFDKIWNNQSNQENNDS